MNWKIFSFTVLIVLTLTVLAYDVKFYSIPSNLYMRSGKWKLPFLRSDYATLDNVSYYERIHIINYLKVGDNLGQRIEVSNEKCPIRDWAESMFNTHRPRILYGEYLYNQALFNVKLNESEYYQVSLLQAKAYTPQSFEYGYIAILNILTVFLWIVFLRRYI